MPRIQYVGGIAGVDIPLVGLTDVKPGDVFDASDEQAACLLESSIYVTATATQDEE